MLSSIYGTNGIRVFNGTATTIPYVGGDVNSAGPGISGELRVIGNSLHVWMNGYWSPLHTNQPTIELSSDVLAILEWGRKAMIREQELEQLSEKYPSVRVAAENLKIAQDQLDLIAAIVHEHE